MVMHLAPSLSQFRQQIFPKMYAWQNILKNKH